MRQGLPQLTERGGAGDVAVGAEVDVFDRRIRGGGVHGLHGIPDADGLGAAGSSGQQGRGIHPGQRIRILGLLAERHLGQVEAQDAGFGQGRGAAAGGEHRAEEAEAEDKTDNSDQEDAADDGKDHFDKIFHRDKRNI